MDKYEEMNNQLYNYYLEEYFYKAYKNKEYKKLEFIFSPYCNLNCKYCYLNHYYNKQFPLDSFNSKISIENAKKVCKWLIKNHYTPSLDIFSGELFSQECGFELLETIYSIYKDADDKDKLLYITIPTNASFVFEQEKRVRVKQLINKFTDIGIPLYLSFSVDGIYMDKANRGQEIDYDKIFSFASGKNIGFHPMIYSNNIEKWKDNFIWFQEQFKKYNINGRHLYLLHVRNKEWTKPQIKELYDFVIFLMNYAWENECNKDCKSYIKFLCDPISRGYNLLNWLTNQQKGYGCGIQCSIHLRLNDMKVFPCHRLMYPELEIGQYDENMNFITTNAALGIGITNIKIEDTPVCSSCDINTLCCGSCIGSNYETNHSLLMPIPTVCLSNIAIFKALVDGYENLGILEEIKAMLPQESQEQIEKLRRFTINELLS